MRKFLIVASRCYLMDGWMDDPFSKTSRAIVNSFMPPPLLPLPSFRRPSSTSRVSSAKFRKQT